MSLSISKLSNNLIMTIFGAASFGFILGSSLSKTNESLIDRVRLRIASIVLNSYTALFGDSSSTTKTLKPSEQTITTKTSARHVAIIMDGNRRYGKAKHGDALKGHWDGGQTLVDCVKWCMEFGVEVFTVYAFSTENWKRPPEEIDLLMSIFCKFATKCEEEAMENNIKITVLSTDRNRLPAEVISAINHMEERTIKNTGLMFNLAVSYGGRSDLVQATQKCIEDVNSGVLSQELLEECNIKQRLSTRDLPELDVLIRTSGERRLSNFLLFECAYAELFFIDKFWPELTRNDLQEVLNEFDERHRRFGR